MLSHSHPMCIYITASISSIIPLSLSMELDLMVLPATLQRHTVAVHKSILAYLQLLL